MIALILILILIFQAVADVLYYNGKKKMSKLIECLYIVLFIGIPFFYENTEIKSVIAIGILYLFLRMSLFDIFYNVTAGLSIYFVGSTTLWYDDILEHFKNWIFWVYRIFWLFIAITVYVLEVIDYEKFKF